MTAETASTLTIKFLFQETRAWGQWKVCDSLTSYFSNPIGWQSKMSPLCIPAKGCQSCCWLKWLPYLGMRWSKWRHHGLMVSALDSGLSGPCQSPGWRHCVVSLGKTLYSHDAFLHPGVQMGTRKFNAGSNFAMDWHPIQGGTRNTPSRFMLQKPRYAPA